MHSTAVEAPLKAEAEAEEQSRYADGWSIRAALQAIFPPAPTIVGFRMGHLLPSLWFYQVMVNLLCVPERRTTKPVQRKPAEQHTADPHTPRERERLYQVDSGSTRRFLATSSSSSLSSSLLFDAASAPCHVSRARASVSLSVRESLRWEEHIACGADDCQHTQSGTPLHTPVLEASAAVRFQRQQELAATTQQKTAAAAHIVWSSHVAHDSVQVCADVTGASLRAFTMQELGQRGPTLLFLAEKPYVAGDEHVRSRSVPLPKRVGQAEDALPADQSCLAAAMVSHVAVATRRVPVEAHAERIPLARTSGTAALQLALQRAVVKANWLTAFSPSVEDKKLVEGMKCGTVATSESQLHLVWGSKDWLVEEDAQLAAAEEELLQSLHQKYSSTDLGPVSEAFAPPAGTTTVATLRAWLPSRWTTERNASMIPPVHSRQESGDELYNAPGIPGASAYESAPPGFTGEACLPPPPQCRSPQRTSACFSWMFRVRKSWLVTGLSHATQALVFSTQKADQASSSSSPHRAALTTTRSQASPPAPFSAFPINSDWQPNYNLLTGMPLDLLLYRSLMHKKAAGAEKDPSSSVTSRRQTRNAGSHTAASPREAASVDDACVDDEENDGALLDPPSLRTQSPAFLETGLSPLCYAQRSQRVGWVPVQREQGVQGAAPDTEGHPPHHHHHRSTTTRWRLPAAMRSFVLPASADRVRTPQLTDGAAPLPSHVQSTASPPSCFAGVAVPQRELFSGFFLHDAPSWFHEAVLDGALTEKEKVMGTGNGADESCGAQKMSPAAEGAYLLGFLSQHGYVPAAPYEAAAAGNVKTSAACASDTNASSSLEDAKTAEGAAVPTVCVLRLRAIPPKVKKQPTVKSGTFAAAPELFWSTFRGDASDATVNYMFSLAQVRAMAATATPSTSSRTGASHTSSRRTTEEADVLYFVEVKAALEVLRRVAVAARPASSASPGSLSSPFSAIWPLLDTYYRDNTMEWRGDAAKKGKAKEGGYCREVDEGATSTSASVDLGEQGTREAAESGAAAADRVARDTAAVVTAYCHPAPSEVVYRLVCLIADLQRARSTSLSSSTGQGSGAPEEPHCSYAERTNNDRAAPSALLATWPRGAYHTFLQAALGTSSPSTTTTTTTITRPTVDDSPVDVLNTSHSTEEAEAALTGTTYWVKDGHRCEQTPAASLKLPHGVKVYTYDDDGTRAMASTRDASAAAEVAPTSVHNDSVYDSFYNSAELYHTPSRAQLVQLDAPSTALVSPTIAERDRELTVPHICFQSSPPVPVKTLGKQRAESIVAAHEQSKRQGYLPALRRGKHHQQQHQLTRWSASPARTAPPTFQMPAPVSSTAAFVPAVEDTESSTPRVRDMRSSCDIGGALFRQSEEVREKAAVAHAEDEHAGFVEQVCDHETQSHPIREKAPRATTRTALPSPAPPSLDVVGVLVQDEEQRFQRLWQPWLRYLPPELQLPSSTGVQSHKSRHKSTSVVDLCLNTTPITTAASDPRLTFPFLQPSRLATYHLCPARRPRRSSECEDLENAPDPQLDNDSSAGGEDTVQANDLGLSVLQLRYDEMYVNASNLIYREDASNSSEQ